MTRSICTLLPILLMVIPVTQHGMFAQQSPQVRGTGEAGGRPPLLFREEWKQPPYTGELDDVKRRIVLTQDALSNPNLERSCMGRTRRICW